MDQAAGPTLRATLTAIVTALVVAACAAGPTPSPGAVPTPVPTAAASPTPVERTPAGPADEVVVTLGIYSGRPDPAWTLTGAEAAAVLRVIDALPEAAGSPPQGGLGYHGFTVTSLARTFTAYLGVVAAGGAGPQILRSDPGRTVERLLLETGRTELTPAEIAGVEQSLSSAP